MYTCKTVLLLTIVAEVSAGIYWKSPFNSLFDYKQLIEFYVLHIEMVDVKEKKKTEVRL